MAFVVRSPKKLDFFHSETGPIGPGEYDKTLSPKEPNSDFLNAPFNSSSNRCVSNDFDTNPEVGPGSYRQNSSFIKKSFSTQSIDSDDAINLAMYKLIEKKRKQLSLSKKELKIENSIPKVMKETINKGERGKHYIKIIQGTKTKKRIASIPSKLNFGYDVDNDGRLKMIDDPNKMIRYSGDKNDSVAPDYYYKTKRIKSNALDWKKMSKKDLENNKSDSGDFNTKEESATINNANKSNSNQTNINQTMNSSNNNINNISISKNPGVDYISRHLKKIDKARSMKNMLYNTKASMRSSSTSTTNTIRERAIEDMVQSNLFSVSPGPGYYFGDDTSFSKTLNRTKSQCQCFGSTAERKMKLSNLPNYKNVGPGSYYHTHLNTLKPNMYLFYRRENPDTYIPNKINKEKEKAIVGPGKYMIKSQFDVEKAEYSGPCQRRFNYSLKEENILPGPADYISLKEWGQQETTLPLRQKNLHRDIRRFEYKTTGVGSYNPQILSSIGYKIISKENKFQSVIAPFSSGQERFLEKSHSTSDIVGPGCYNYAKSSFDKKKNNEVVKETKPLQEYVEKKKESERQVGPGSYGMYDYNQWNKKSFNILFA